MTILDVFEAIGAHAAGEMSDEDLRELEDVASPGAGACGGQFTANTMACAFEALGISPGGLGDGPRRGRRQATASPSGSASWRCGCSSDDLRPSRIITRNSLENAIAMVCASGGSTNGVLHLLAVAREIGIELDIDDFERISRSDAAARRPQARRPLRRHRPLPRRRRAADPQAPRRGGHPARRRAHRHRPHDRRGGRRRHARPTGQEVVRPLDDPLKSEGGLAILRGNLAPEGCGRQARRHRAQGPDRPGARLRVRGGLLPRRQGPGSSSPATSS